MPLEVCFVYLLGLLDGLLLGVLFLILIDFFVKFLLQMFVLVVFFGVKIWDVLRSV